MRRVIGIDPGLIGGLAVLDLGDDGSVDAALHRTPTLLVRRGRRVRREYDPAGMSLLLALAGRGASCPVEVVLEAQSARPGQGVVSMYRLGYGVGLWLGLVVGVGLPYRTVAPAVWKRAHGLLGADKRASRLRCAERFPALAPIAAADEGGSEALLLATYVAGHGGAPPDGARQGKGRHAAERNG